MRLGLGGAQSYPVLWLDLHILKTIATCLGSSLENEGLFAGATAESECAHCFSGSIFEAVEHLVQTFMAECFHE